MSPYFLLRPSERRRRVLRRHGKLRRSDSVFLRLSIHDHRFDTRQLGFESQLQLGTQTIDWQRDYDVQAVGSEFAAH